MNSNSRILIVDGSRGARKMLSLKLEQLGYHPVTAGSSNQALAKLSTTPADVICTALSLPDESGLRFISALRKLPGEIDTPVIIVSGNETSISEIDPTNAYQIATTVDKGKGIDFLVGKITEFCEFNLTTTDQASVSTV